MASAAQLVQESDGDERRPKLSFLNKYLSLWVLLACGTGLGLGQIPGVVQVIMKTSVGTTNIFVALGLIFMILPPLARVRWNTLPQVFDHRKLLLLNLFLNWVLGPFLMFFLSVMVFYNEKYIALRSGLSLVGCARCIAMVLVWNQLAGGDTEYCAALVALNSVITIALYSPYAVLFVKTLPESLHLATVASIPVTAAGVAESVVIYLGIPFAAGILLWATLTKKYGEDWYFHCFSPRLNKLSLLSLLFTVTVLFAFQSENLTTRLEIFLYSFVPMQLYFILMFVVSFHVAYFVGATYSECVTLAFTAASNNFELALAVAVSAFGLNSDEALMSVVGALIEIPTMLFLVSGCYFLKSKLHWNKVRIEGTTITAINA